MSKKVEVSRDNPLAYVKAAAACIDADDDAIFEALRGNPSRQPGAAAPGYGVDSPSIRS